MPKIHNHYIPKYYLKGFTDASDSDKIFVYEKGKNEPFQTKIKSIGNELGLYTDELEVLLANDIENSANPILKKLRNFQSITHSEKIALSSYMITMRKRVPKHLNWVIEKSPKWLDTSFSNVENQLRDLAEKNPEKSELIELRIQELHNIRKIKSAELIRDSWMKNIPASMDSSLVQTLTRMEWRFLYCEDELLFLASDNPLFYFESMGIGNEKSEVTFPLAKNLALWAKWEMNMPSGFYKAQPQFVKEVNRRTVSSAMKYLFSPQTADWIPSLMNKKNIRLNRVL